MSIELSIWTAYCFIPVNHWVVMVGLVMLTMGLTIHSLKGKNHGQG